MHSQVPAKKCSRGATSIQRTDPVSYTHLDVYKRQNLYLAIHAGTLADGLAGQIETFVQEHGRVSLIVIDTLQKVREACTDNTYARDYTDLAQLKELADRCKTTVLLVHHLRKQYDSDPLNRVSGTAGMSGAADGTFILQREDRSSNYGTLFCTCLLYTSILLILGAPAALFLCRKNYAPLQELARVISPQNVAGTQEMEYEAMQAVIASIFADRQMLKEQILIYKPLLISSLLLELLDGSQQKNVTRNALHALGIDLSLECWCCVAIITEEARHDDLVALAERTRIPGRVM